MRSLPTWAQGAIRSGENLLKVDMIYLLKGNFWQMIGQGLGSALSLFLLYLFANYLPKETYGLYRYILSIAGLLGMFSLTGMNQAVAQAVANGKDGVLRSSVSYQIKWNLLQTLALSILAFYYFYNGNTVMGFSFLILGIASPLASAFNTYSPFLDGKKNFRLNNLFGVGATLIYVLLMTPIIFYSGETLPLIVVYALSTLLSSLLFYFWTLRLYQPPSAVDQETFRFGRELTFIGLIGPVASQIDKIIVSHFYGATALAIYALALALPDRITSIIKSWVAIGLPKFSTKTPEKIDQVFYTRILQGMGVGLACFLLYYFASPFLFKYFLPKYLDSLAYSQLLACGFIFALPSRYVGLLFTSQKNSKAIFTTQLINSLLRVVLFLGLGITHGIMGLILANVLFAGLGMLVNIFAWKRATAKTSA